MGLLYGCLTNDKVILADYVAPKYIFC